MEAADQVDVFLQPGDWFVGDHTYRIRTLLGSCVSITLWHRGLRVGAMSHFLLPEHSRGGMPDGRYGADALALMLEGLRGYGVQGSDCQAKIFGGGDMFPGQLRCGISIGEKNGAAARALLAGAGIALVSESLFGSGHRQILFDVASGDVWSRQIDKPAGAKP
jgi:chemotaxis protein CheD